MLSLASFFVGVPALILCIAGLVQINTKDDCKGNGLCVFGLIMSIVAIIFYVGRI